MLFHCLLVPERSGRNVKNVKESEERRMNVNGAFRFHNVGQGLFYSGILSKKSKHKHNVFSFVYDCGTNSDISFLQREIDDYKLLLPTKGTTSHKKLSLLVVSHLHDDHVNGIEYLLKDIEVDTVVMPYINNNLKLFAQLESHSNNEFLQVFYTDPVGWFLSKGVHRILFIGSEDIAEEGDSGSLNNESQYVGNRDIDVEQQSILKIDHLGETEILYLKNKAQVDCNGFYWEFHFENLKLDQKKVNKYIEIVETFMKERKLTLEQILKSKSHLGDLRKEVKQAFLSNILNRTSVVLLHRPRECNMAILCCSPHCNYLKYLKGYFVRRDGAVFSCSTILTGDIKLKDDEHLEMLNQCTSCLLVQYPHHGSENNYMKYFTDLGARVNVISYGITNRYGHPHGKVLKSLRDIAFVNERDSFSYQIMIKDFEDEKMTQLADAFPAVSQSCGND